MPFTTATHAKQYRLMGAVAVVALAMVAALFAVSSSAQPQARVRLSLDGNPSTVTTAASTVAELLSARGVVITGRDVVAPALDTAIADGSAVSVRFARPLEVAVDGQLKRYWVTATDLSGALSDLGLRFSGSVLSAKRSATLSRSGLRVAVVTPKRVTLAIAGRKPVKKSIAATTVGQALKKRGISRDRNDIVKPKATKPLKQGMRISLTRIDFNKSTVRNQAVPFTTTYTEDDGLAEGSTQVKVAGVTGSRDATYRAKLVNGKVVSKTLVAVANQTAPRNAVIAKGTRKVIVVSAPVLSPSVGYGVWDRLAQCESGGNWQINTGNGYYGGLQFNIGTWRAYGGPGYPHQQSRETQISIATKLRDARGGYGAWPACSAKLGLPR